MSFCNKSQLTSKAILAWVSPLLVDIKRKPPREIQRQAVCARVCLCMCVWCVTVLAWVHHHRSASQKRKHDNIHFAQTLAGKDWNSASACCDNALRNAACLACFQAKGKKRILHPDTARSGHIPHSTNALNTRAHMPYSDMAQTSNRGARTSKRPLPSPSGFQVPRPWASPPQLAPSP
jgi:hypothetical protein